MFIHLWQGLRDLYQDNKSSVANETAKRFINWTVRDISNAYDWEFLRSTTSITPSADGEYNLNPITQISGATATIYAIGDNALDNGTIVSMWGDKLNSTVSSNPTISSTYTEFTVSATVSASSTGWSDIQCFYKPATNGVIYMTNGTTVIATLGASQTYVANDIRKVNRIVDAGGNDYLEYIDYATQLKGNPNSGNVSDIVGYDFNGAGRIQFFETNGNTYTVLYQKLPKYLINDWDRTEFPREFYQDIIEYAYRVYGKQYQDEATAINDAQITDLKKVLIGHMISKWTMGGEYKPKRILPRNFVRRV